MARTVEASLPFGPKLETNGHVEPRQRATAHARLHPLQVATPPPAAAPLGPFESAFDAEAPVSLRGPLRPEDASGGPVPWPLNQGVHRLAPRQPGAGAAHKPLPLTLVYRVARHGSSGRTKIRVRPVAHFKLRGGDNVDQAYLRTHLG
jgi:hypothetical protein